MAKATRTYGQGSLYQRGETWWASYMLNGKRERVSTGLTDKTAAKTWLKRKLGEIVRGEAEPQPKKRVSGVTVVDVLNAYVDGKVKLAAKTLATYRGQIENHLVPFFGDILVTDVNYEVLDRYRKQRSSEYVQDPIRRGTQRVTEFKRKLTTQSTINREVTLVGSALREHQKKNPRILIPQLPKESEMDCVRHGFIRENQLLAFLALLPVWLQCFVACAFYCGGRVSEWVRVDWEDVDFEAGLIYFPNTKNKHPREVPIWDEREGSVMREYLMRQRQLVIETTGAEPKPNDPVFLGEDGRRIMTFVKRFKSAANKLGRRGMTPHDLRRSANKWMRDHGVDQATRMYIMGHRTQSMDLRYGMADKSAIAAAREAVQKKKSERKGKAA